MRFASPVIKLSYFFLLAYNLSPSNAQTCATPTGVKCLDQSLYVNCVDSVPVVETAIACAIDSFCYGSAATAAEICRPAPCTATEGSSFPLIGAPNNVYYTCLAGNVRIYRTCTSGSFNTTTGACEVARTTTVLPMTVPTNPPCNRNKRIEDPTSCNHFYMCNILGGGTSRRMRCPFRMRFNSNLGKCAARFLTACGNRPENV